MKLISWNVNGVRAVLGKGFLDFVEGVDADVICLQESKAQPDQLDHVVWPEGYEVFWNAAEKKGYSGTGVMTRQKPLKVWNGLGMPEHDREGRVQNLEYEGYILVNVYTPNAQHGLARLEYRMAWDAAFRTHVGALRKKKPVIFCGDLNVAQVPL